MMNAQEMFRTIFQRMKPEAKEVGQGPIWKCSIRVPLLQHSDSRHEPPRRPSTAGGSGLGIAVVVALRLLQAQQLTTRAVQAGGGLGGFDPPPSTSREPN